VNKKKKKKKRSKKKPKLVNGNENEDTVNEIDSADTTHHCTPIAWSEFGLHEKLGQALHRIGFHTPTPIQSAVMKASLGTSAGGAQDVMGAAQTGSGKTLAYGLPMIDWWLRKRQTIQEADDDNLLKPFLKKLVGLVLCPTRELALQVSVHLNNIVENTLVNTKLPTSTPSNNGWKFVVCTLVGGLSEEKQIRQLDKRPPIVVGTVGRVWEMMSQGHEHLKHVNRIRFLVIDEADRMVQKGSFKELDFILTEVTKPLKKSDKKQRSQAYRLALAKQYEEEIQEKEELGEEGVTSDSGQEEEEEEEEEENLSLTKSSVKSLLSWSQRYSL